MLKSDLPIALAKWDDDVKWVLDRVDGFPKNQRFVLGTRLADGVLGVMEVLAEATYARKEITDLPLDHAVPCAGQPITLPRPLQSHCASCL
jgi:hypothetical protein